MALTGLLFALLACGLASAATIDGATLNQTTLPNGLKVWHLHRPDSASMAVVVDVRVGARNETVDNNGIAHLLEHYVHSGTRRWSASEVDRELDRLGGVTDRPYGAIPGSA